jgi:NAD(P)-dependent dehydrogenase (short-subunit alcohol dehydrogenase family)
MAFANFSGRKAIVTGAGKGIGRETARLLAEQGAEVLAISRTQSDLDSLAAEIGCATIRAELADPEQARAAARQALPADFLVNCAGINILEKFVDVAVESFDEVYAVNTRAAMIIAQEFARERIASGRPGAIVNVSSISSFIGFADHASYCASKGALDAMSRVMANELGVHGIRVNCINPIVTMTELAARAWSDPAKSEPVLSRIPLRRFAEVSDIAATIAFLLSDESRMINGLAMPVDGGFMAR